MRRTDRQVSEPSLRVAGAAVSLLLTDSTLGAGQNFSVPCDLPEPVREITWFHLHGERVAPLLSLSLTGMNLTSFEPYHHPRVFATGDIRDRSGLDLIAVNRSDAGLYFCVGRDRLRSFTGRVLRLSFGGKTV